MKFPSPVGVRPLTQVPDFKDAAQVFMSFPSPVGVRPLTQLTMQIMGHETIM